MDDGAHGVKAEGDQITKLEPEDEDDVKLEDIT